MLKRTKQLLAIEEKINHLVELVESEEYKKLKKDSEELAKTKSLLAHVKFKIKETRVVEDQETGEMSIIVTYELPRIVLKLDENGNPSKDEFFYSSNMLDMISLEDMSKFQNILRNAKKGARK